MTDDRAQELSGRWGNSDDEDNEQADSQIDEQASETNGQTDDEDEQAKKRRKLTTRERESQMVYLRPDQYEQLHGTWLDLEYRFGRKRGIDLEKSRDFLVPLLELGMAQLGDVESRDLDELADLLGIEDQ
ncbi:hypothetical protein [Haladaptatus sp. DYF46]|uniref:hypothetical protein n=1 Tax=Haladaptatus sp. DYF46 TaxID=2886041 RepID=UPI001E581FAC|nr:hypothetical protein [Haladaptatus sp. DYF46]